MYDRILVATDGETASENAVEHAIDLAAAHGATLHALYVVDETVYSAYSGDEFVDEHEGPEHALEVRGEETLEEVEGLVEAAGIEAVTTVEYGVPSTRIVDYAEEGDVDLVVLGSRHRTDEYRSLLGGVTERVVRITDRPVLIVKTSSAPGDR